MFLQEDGCSELGKPQCKSQATTQARHCLMESEHGFWRRLEHCSEEPGRSPSLPLGCWSMGGGHRGGATSAVQRPPADLPAGVGIALAQKPGPSNARIAFAVSGPGSSSIKLQFSH